MERFLVFIFILIVSLNIVTSAEISGTIYDLSLNQVSYAVVELNTSPKQRYVAVNGSYQFSCPVGSYKIVAFVKKDSTEMRTEENILVNSDGDFVLDLFLYPELRDIEELYEEFDFEPPYYEETSSTPYWMIIPVFLLLLIFLLFPSTFRRKKIDTDDDLVNIINFLKANKGRVNQKELKAKFGVSDAKISLMLSELETQGKIQRIKRGRTNLIILRK